MGEPTRPAGRVETTAWFAGGAAAIALAVVALAYGVVRLSHPGIVFQYTEGPVLGSLAALVDVGSTRALYPADGWTDPPLVLTLYPPLFFWLSAGLHRLVGSPELLIAPRLLSLAAILAVPLGLAGVARRRGVPWTWTALLLGALLITPAAFNLVGGAQVDGLAVAFTLAGLLTLLARRDWADRDGRQAVALLFFLLALFTKQSFVAAPLATALALAARGRRLRAVVFLSVFAGLALSGVVLLGRATEGGFSANALGALGGFAGLEGLRLNLSRSAPWQWSPLLLLVWLGVRRRLRFDLPEAYVGVAWPMHVAALARTGASVNYLFEPLVALVLLGVARAPAGPESRGAQRVRPRFAVGLVAAWVLLAAGGVGASRLAELSRFAAQPAGFSIAGLGGGYPLTDVGPFPAILRAGTRPYLNDPFAFGVLLDAGLWSEARLVADLRSRDVPFVFPSVDLDLGPAPPGARARDLLFGTLWLSPPIWAAITEGYEPLGERPPRVWLPRPTAGGSPEAP